MKLVQPDLDFSFRVTKIWDSIIMDVEYLVDVGTRFYIHEKVECVELRQAVSFCGVLSDESAKDFDCSPVMTVYLWGTP